MLSGDNSILTKSTDAREKTEQSVNDEKRKITVYNAIFNNEKTTYKGITIPTGFAPTEVEGESTVDEGNEIKTSKIATALQNYCKNDIDGNTLILGNSMDVWRDSTGKPSSTSTNLEDDKVCGLTSSQYTKLYNKMLTSIYKNGGFWIGRYEAGMTTPKTNKEGYGTN